MVHQLLDVNGFGMQALLDVPALEAEALALIREGVLPGLQVVTELRLPSGPDGTNRLLTNTRCLLDQLPSGVGYPWFSWDLRGLGEKVLILQPLHDLDEFGMICVRALRE